MKKLRFSEFETRASSFLTNEAPKFKIKYCYLLEDNEQAPS